MGEKAFQLLRQAILSNTLKPGEQLPIEELATANRMSRTPIREALAELARIGLVESHPRHSARVARLSPEDLKDIYDARLALEVAAIAAAATKFEEIDRGVAAWWLEQLRGALAAGEVAAAVDSHARFHFALYRAGGSRWLARLLDPVWDCSERYLLAAVDPEEVLLQARMSEHERLLAACASGNSEVAAAELWSHLAHTANTISRAMGGVDIYKK
jgi:DNA-binding GntR family transcriptional regulator